MRVHVARDVVEREHECAGGAAQVNHDGVHAWSIPTKKGKLEREREI